jgi:phosphoglucosamine mutase
VLEKMMALGLNLGGEQSGHLILWDLNTTGDGLVAALELLRIMKFTESPPSDLRKVLHKYPQSLVNLKIPKKVPFAEIPDLTETLASLDDELAGKGRVVVRYSGTEAKVRILVECKDPADLKRVSERASAPFVKYFGL